MELQAERLRALGTGREPDFSFAGPAYKKLVEDQIVIYDSQIEAAVSPHFEVIDHGGALPSLLPIHINMYLADGPKRPMIDRLAALVREAYGVGEGASMAAE